MITSFDIYSIVWGHIINVVLFVAIGFFSYKSSKSRNAETRNICFELMCLSIIAELFLLGIYFYEAIRFLIVG